jgi:hypothetical protein
MKSLRCRQYEVAGNCDVIITYVRVSCVLGLNQVCLFDLRNQYFIYLFVLIIELILFDFLFKVQKFTQSVDSYKYNAHLHKNDYDDNFMEESLSRGTSST